ncbi:MAG: hypothetical protein L0H15_07145 [Nitrosospira sp.]|nr:hypothetical protein [Nitrosospira sp.]
MHDPLEDIARRVNWYTPASRLLADGNRFLAEVMARGTADDIALIQRQFTPDDLKKAYCNAPPGLFSNRAWAYWGLMLLNDPKHPLPKRFPGTDSLDWRG